MSLQGKNIQIFQITGKKFSDHNSIEFSLHKSVPYLQQTSANKVILANEITFNSYKVGDHLGIDVGKTSFRFSDVWGKIYNNSAVVVKVKKDENAFPNNHRNVYHSEEFGGGWVEE